VFGSKPFFLNKGSLIAAFFLADGSYTTVTSTK
jgi:hypothetical protein